MKQIGEQVQGAGGRLVRLGENLYQFRDACHVYLLKSGNEAVLIDFGSGDILEHLEAMGVDRVTDVLMTHHHRDQAQGLPRAQESGIRIWVPRTELGFFEDVDWHWQARALDNSYNNRQDRYSLLEPVAVSGTLDDYATRKAGGYEFEVIPTPGHTTGSVTLLATVDGRCVAFCGDLIAGPGKVWSLAATQWSYNGAEGVAASLASLLDLRDRGPRLLLPSHGEVMDEPAAAIDQTNERLWRLLRGRGENPRLFELRERPYEALSLHLLFNRTSNANGFVLLSESGNALFIDFGYDFMVGEAAGSDRASRRPWLYTLGELKRQFGVERVEVVLPTHFHDDHVAGINLLRRVEGAEVWAADLVAPVLERPLEFDLPCLWYEPIPVDRELPLEQPIRWREYELTLHHVPGHAHRAVAISFEVDGLEVLALGDQFEGGTAAEWNYVYNNGFANEDYFLTAELLERLRPDLLLAGHYPAHTVDDAFIARVREGAERLESLHRELLPVEEFDLAGRDRAVTLQPYRSVVRSGERIDFTASVTNPFPSEEPAQLRPVLPEGWRAEPESCTLTLPPGGSGNARFTVIPRPSPTRRARVAVDLSIGSSRLGQQAEAIVTVEAASAADAGATRAAGREEEPV